MISEEERARWMSVFFATDREIARCISERALFDRRQAQRPATPLLDKATALAVLTEFSRQLEKHDARLSADLVPHYVESAAHHSLGSIPSHAERGGACVALLTIIVCLSAIWFAPLPFYGKFVGTLLFIAAALVVSVVRDVIHERRARRRSQRGQINLLQTRPPDHPSVLDRHTGSEDAYLD